MKKLTAGIFTVMLGLSVAVDANAAITSKKYVDDALALKADTSALNAVKTTADGAVQTTEFTTFQTTNTAAIADAKKAGTDAAAALDTYKGEVTTALGTKQNTLQEASISGNDAAGNVITGISANNGVITVTKATVATAEGLEELETRVDTAEGDITTLKGDKTVEGSVAKSIADEIAKEVTRANGAYDAKGAAADAQTAAIAAAKTETTSQVNALADGQVKANTDAIAAMDTAYKAADTAINNKIGTLPEGVTSITQLITNTTGDNSELAKSVKANADAINAIETSDVMTSGATKAKIDAIATNTAAIETNAAEIAKKANTTDLKRLATAEVPAGCETGECVLKYKGGVYSWEPIELTYTAGTAE